MAAGDYAYFDHEMNAFGYWTEDGAFHEISAYVHDQSAVV